MAYQKGTATSDIDLLDKLNIFLTTNPDLVASGDNWTTIYSGSVNATATERERRMYAWSAPGATSNNSIYIAAYTLNNIASDYYNLYFSGGTYFNKSLVDKPENVLNGLINKNTAVGLFADNRTFNYWFFANNRRFIVVTKLTTVYSSAYCGFMLPSCLPAEYPYPLVIAGSCDNNARRYSIQTDYFTSISDPRNGHFYLLRPGQTWEQYYGSKGSSTKLLYPRAIESFFGESVINTIAPSPDSYFPLHPVSIIDITNNATQFWGALDGIYWVPGLSRASEDTIQIDDGRKFIIFQNGFRVTNLDFFAIEQI